MDVSKKDIVLGYISQGLNVGVGLFILPIALNKLSSNDMGLWLIFMSIVSMVVLLDFGFSPTVSRNITYVLSGAKSLEKTGVNLVYNNGESIDYPLYFRLIETTRRIYKRIGNISFILLSTLGTLYLTSIIYKDNISNPEYIYITWAIYAISITFNMYYLYFSPVLLGRGDIAKSYLVNIINRSVMIALSVIGLLMGYGLVSLAIAYSISIVVDRVCCYKFLNDRRHVRLKKEFSTKWTKSECQKLIQVLRHNSSRIGLVSLGAVLINKSSSLIAGYYLPLSESASYIMTFQILWVIMSVSQIYFQTHVPLFSRLQISGNRDQMKIKYVQCLFITLVFMAIGILMFVFFGPWIIENLIHSNTKLLPVDILLVVSLILFLELNHSVAATFITTTNKIPFVKPALISGVSIIILSVVSISYFKLGLWGLILSQGIVQLAYNNWKWPVFVYKMLKIN